MKRIIGDENFNYINKQRKRYASDAKKIIEKDPEIVTMFKDYYSYIGAAKIKQFEPLFNKYSLNENHILMNIVQKSAKIKAPCLGKSKKQENLFYHPYIYGFVQGEKGNIILDTKFGLIVFSKFVNEKSVIKRDVNIKSYLKYHSNINNFSMRDFTGMPEEAFVMVGINDLEFKNTGYIHYWAELNDFVFDLSNNFTMQQETYYNLNNTKIISKIPIKTFTEMFDTLMIDKDKEKFKKDLKEHGVIEDPKLLKRK